MGHDGRQVWAERNELVYTIDNPESELPLEILTYCVSNTQKAVYQEHIIEEEDGKKGKKAKGLLGKQRGFLVRVDNEERVRVMGPFQAAVNHLLANGVITRVDVDDSSAQKRKGKAKAEPEEVSQVPEIPLGTNECRVTTVARCQHQAHGVGFRLDVAEIDSRQKIFIFTGKELKMADWHTKLVEAVTASGSRVMLGRLFGANAPDEPSKGGSAGPSGAKLARESEDAWLDSLMGRCLVVKEAKKEDGGKVENGVDEEASSEKPKKVLPPWLQR